MRCLDAELQEIHVGDLVRHLRRHEEGFVVETQVHDNGGWIFLEDGRFWKSERCVVKRRGEQLSEPRIAEIPIR